jgi:hypothetical protein
VVFAVVPTVTLGRSSGPLITDSSCVTVSEDVMAAVKLEIMMIATNIQMSPKIRPASMTGALSP